MEYSCEQMENIIGDRKVWLTSDLHFFKEMVNGENRSEEKAINKVKLIINNQNALVKDNDIYIVLGDLGHRDFTDKQRLVDEVSKLKGIKILVKGNHDFWEDGYYRDMGFAIVCDSFRWREYLFTHFPMPEKLFSGAKMNIHGHIHGCAYENMEAENHIDVCVSSKVHNYRPVDLKTALRNYSRDKYYKPSITDPSLPYYFNEPVIESVAKPIFLSVLMEAEKDIDEEEEGTDYGDEINTIDADEDDNNPPEEEATDYGADVDNDTTDEETPEANTEDDTVEPEEDEGTDYGDDVDTTEADDAAGTDEMDADDTTPTDTDEEPMEGEENSASGTLEDEQKDKDRTNKLTLINDFEKLYNAVNNAIEKLNYNRNTTLLLQQIIKKVNTNMQSLKSVVSDYIMYDLSKNSYIESLTMYNYLLEAFKVNVAMLKKIPEVYPKSESK